MYLKVRAKTGMKKEEVLKRSPSSYEVSVREEPKQNRANRRIIELMALHLRLPAGKVRIVSGHHSPSKILSVDDGR